jgi:serine O-acetyltransferase
MLAGLSARGGEDLPLLSGATIWPRRDDVRIGWPARARLALAASYGLRLNAIYLYRLARRFHQLRVPVLPRLLEFVIFILYNSIIPATAEIGEGSRFAYGAIGVVLNKRTRLGRAVLVGQNVTIGGSFGSGVPVVGDNVFIGPGARILGDVVVGSNVIIGANAVVIRDVDDNTVVAGVPAQPIGRIEAGALVAVDGVWARPDPAEVEGGDARHD